MYLKYKLCFMCFLATLMQGNGLYFARQTYQSELPVNFPIQMPFYQVYALKNTSEPLESQIHYGIKNVSLLSATIREKSKYDNLFTIEPTKGTIFLNDTLNHIINKSKTVIMDVVAYIHWGKSAQSSAETRIHIALASPEDSNCPKNENNVDKMCFYGINNKTSYSLEVFEYTRPATLARMGSLVYKTLCPNIAIGYTFNKGNHQSDIFSIAKLTGEISEVSELVFEQYENIPLSVLCEVCNGGHCFFSNRSILISVLDVNNHGPQVIGSQEISIPIRELQKEHTIPAITDKDQTKTNKYEIKVIKDPMNFFKIGKIIMTSAAAKQPFRTIIQAELIRQNQKPLIFDTPVYNFSVLFHDTTKVPQENSTVEIKVSINNIKFENKTFDANTSYHATVHRNAAKYSRVFSHFSKIIKEHNELSFSLDTNSEAAGIFSTTPKIGIVYVANSKALHQSNAEHYILTLRWNSSRANLSNYTQIIVQLIGQLDDLSTDCGGSEDLPTDCDHEDNFCSEHRGAKSCAESCGLGAPAGRCQMKHGNTTAGKLNGNYSTCTPDVSTCPDQKCDELENLHRLICPQDCTTAIKGEGSLNKGYKSQGIASASGVCTCDCKAECLCSSSSTSFSDYEHNDPESDEDFHLQDKVAVYNRINISSHIKENQTKQASSVGKYKLNVDYESLVCGQNCMMILTLVGSFTFILVISLLTICRYYRMKAAKKHKHVGSVMSLSAVPSDYVEEHASSNQPHQCIHETSHFMGIKLPVDKKWEFPRKDLILDDGIGEGEFGQVVRAQAYKLHGKDGYVTVAVKMLKHNASTSELRDLLSEYNLLKDISHPNVIRLLGACTQKGPFYMIVEYAEHGSLRNYLRRTRIYRDTGHLELEPNEVCLSTINEDCHVTARDLVSFAWQICKGMSYLSEMKLVHRDLAARNILIAIGKVIKISDFGLTRDVYEGDAYLKRSKGRIPVKWMAIESLYDHIYTTKSDVWSFGIVLWEIVTLGSTPYSGIPAERLFHLLKTEYRMSKPDNCSDELFDIMQICWKESPDQRPTFQCLTRIFDDMLQQNVEYLDLNAIMNQSALTPTFQEKREKSDDDLSDDEYGSIDVLPTDGNEYLTSQRQITEKTRLLTVITEDVRVLPISTDLEERNHVCT